MRLIDSNGPREFQPARLGDIHAAKVAGRDDILVQAALAAGGERGPVGIHIEGRLAPELPWVSLHELVLGGPQFGPRWSHAHLPAWPELRAVVTNADEGTHVLVEIV